MSNKFEINKVSRRRFAVLLVGFLSTAGFLTNSRQTLAKAAFDPSTDNEEKQNRMNVKTFNLPGGDFFPESIGYQPTTDFFFTGSLTNGQIARGNLADGSVITFLPAGANGMTSAAGIKLDKKGRIFVAGGSNGNIFIYQAENAQLLATLQVDTNQTVVNDFAVLPNGDVYVTDSVNPYLYKITSDAQGNFSFDQEWLPLTGTAIKYLPGLNLNGITVSADNRYLIVGQTNTGKLFRIEIATKQVKEINLGGTDVLHADGILLEGQNLYVARNAVNILATVHLSDDFLEAKKIINTTNSAFQFPTALQRADECFLIVNGQLDKIGGSPNLPFNVIAIPIPQQ